MYKNYFSYYSVYKSDKISIIRVHFVENYGIYQKKKTSQKIKSRSKVIAEVIL